MGVEGSGNGLLDLGNRSDKALLFKSLLIKSKSVLKGQSQMPFLKPFPNLLLFSPLNFQTSLIIAFLKNIVI